jgi:hypothetical protein
MTTPSYLNNIHGRSACRQPGIIADFLAQKNSIPGLIALSVSDICDILSLLAYNHTEREVRVI